MMACASCGGDTSVEETRTAPGGVRRRRRCRRCAACFTTYEIRVPDNFGNSVAGRGPLRIVGQVAVDRLRDAAAKLIEDLT